MIEAFIEWFGNFQPVTQTLIATGFTWLVTAVGAALVFLFKSVNRKILDGMLGFAAGVMLAVCVWSLLIPSMQIAKETFMHPWLPTVIGFLVGGLFLRIVDKILPHLHIDFPIDEAEGLKTSWQRSVLLILAITLHNIPEGLAVGIAFGALSANLESASLTHALALTIGIALQNLPEGASVSLPLRREGMACKKCFWYGQLSGFVEPIAGVIGALTVVFIQPVLPYALSFAAGAMMFVIVEELIPESQLSKHTDLATVWMMLGFAVMMVLEVGLG